MPSSEREKEYSGAFMEALGHLTSFSKAVMTEIAKCKHEPAVMDLLLALDPKLERLQKYFERIEGLMEEADRPPSRGP